MKSYSPPTEKKTERIDEMVLAVETGHMCCRGMAWESPFVVFQRTNRDRVIWHSDNVESILDRFGFTRLDFIKDRLVGLKAIIRNGRVWRVQKITDL